MVKSEFWAGIPAYLGKLFDKYKYVLLVCLAGVALLLWPQEEEAAVPAPEETLQEEDRALERRLEELLESMEGVGEARVVLTREDDGETDYAYDQTNTASRTENGGGSSSRQKQLTVLSESGGQAPVTLRRRAPVYRGAVVVCQGGGSPSVRLAVTQAVQSLTGLSADKIVISKMK